MRMLEKGGCGNDPVLKPALQGLAAHDHPFSVVTNDTKGPDNSHVTSKPR